MKSILSLTHKCNLACRYCYSGKTTKQDMSLATARKIVDFTFDTTPDTQKIEFSFFGGEPLVRFDLIQDTIKYVRQKQEMVDRHVTFSITSNGTLLTQSILQFFREEGVDLCISIDGPAVIHDLNRVYKNGRGSFSDVQRNLKMAINELESVQVNAVYNPTTVTSLPETLSFLINLGVSVIHLNPDICAYWTEEAYNKIPQIFTKLADIYIEAYKQGKEIALNFLDSKIILFLKGGYSIQDMCGLGQAELSFAPSGNVYPCERLIGEDTNLSFCIGNIHSNFNLSSYCSELHNQGNRNSECQSCDLKKYCMNWCRCTNYFLTGSPNLVGPFMCILEQSAMRSAESVMIELAKTNNETFIDHLLQYSSEGRYDQQTTER